LLVDDADRADADVERLTQEALRNRKRSSMPMCGCCYGCGEPITGRLFHDASRYMERVTSLSVIRYPDESHHQRRSALADSRAS